ncbi:hypothetical protein ACFVAG_22530 [Streptomyces sp. NPDC057644]|uniref:hypothetical protein n=1 Tax=Streptomyces sp. NPDC057644 TaxID=3346191 RepID=UPI00369126B3
MAWLLGNDQSPGSGHAASAVAPSTARHGRSSSTTSFNASLTAYATTVPAPISTAPATAPGSLRRRAVQQTPSSSRPRTISVASEDSSRRCPSHPGASPTASVSERYAETDAPSVTSVGPGRPRPPGDSIPIPAVAVAGSAAAPNSLSGQWC